VRIEVGADGRPLSVRVIESAGCAELDRAAVEAVKTALFRPALRWGKPVAAPVELPFHFRLE
jgi:periplasmic protein TonB